MLLSVSQVITRKILEIEHAHSSAENKLKISLYADIDEAKLTRLVHNGKFEKSEYEILIDKEKRCVEVYPFP